MRRIGGRKRRRAGRLARKGSRALAEADKLKRVLRASVFFGRMVGANAWEEV